MVQVAEQGAESGGSFQRPRSWLDEPAFDERERLAPVLIETRADQPRGGPESHLFQVLEQRVHGRRPRTGVPHHGVAAAVQRRPAAPFQLDFATVSGHASLSVASRPHATRQPSLWKYV